MITQTLAGTVPSAGGNGAPPATARPSWGYRPHLDGLRSVAVYLVVLFHAGLGRFSGGFVGVDVFFVLSGYLVTNVLLEELDRTGGDLAFTTFYARRARRLLPAATVVLVATAVAFPYLAFTVEVDQALGGVKAAALYVSNWYFVSQSTSYFGAAADASPVAHFWSLSVEEQFYLAWPLLLVALYRAGRRFSDRPRLVMRGAVIAGGLTSLGWAVHLAGSNVDRAYFGTDSRAYQLLAGALLALCPGLIGRLGRWASALLPVAVPAAFGALLVLASDRIELSPVNRGIGVTAVTVALLAGLDAARGGLVARALSLRALVFLGRVSYATYLWHWLITMFLHRETELSDPAVAVVVVVVASGLAALSHVLVEGPVRQSPRLARLRIPVVAAGLGASVLTAVLVAPTLLAESRRTVPSGAAEEKIEVTTANPGEAAVTAAFYDQVETADCSGGPVEQCIRVAGDGPRVLLMGDSHAHMLVPAFVRLAEEHDFTFIDAALQGCPWQRDHFVLNDEIRARCRRIRTDTYERIVPALAPDVILLLNSQDADPRFRPRHAEARDTVSPSLDLLRAPGREIVLIEGIPRSVDGMDLWSCLQSAGYAEQCRYRTPEGEHWLEQLYREQAGQRPDVSVVDIDPLVCPLDPICDSMVDDTIVWRTEGHITGAYAERIAPGLWALLVAEGVIDP